MRARPTSSGTVSPFARSAIRNAAVCTSPARPSMISASTAAAWSAVRWSPAQTASIARVTTSFGMTLPWRSYFVSVCGTRLDLNPRKLRSSSLFALRGEDRLGVELDALGRQLAVAGAHHDVAEAGAQLELVRQVRVGDQRVVAAGDERARQARVRSSCRRARPPRPCRGSDRRRRPGRRRPRPATGGRGRRRAPAFPPRRRSGSPPSRSRPRPACRGPGRRRGGRRRARAARRPWRGRCARPRSRPPARPGTGRGCR